MKVFKFGGASVKDASAVKNLAQIVTDYRYEDLVLVISAMGKTTNALESIAYDYFHKTGDVHKGISDLKKYHNDIIKELFTGKSHKIYDVVNNVFVELDWVIEEEPSKSYSFAYDQIVSVGELLSTHIVSEYLNTVDIPNVWLDARDVIRTDNTYREGRVNWPVTTELVNDQITKLINSDNHLVVTQGFIGSTTENYTTTLGREGSDYSASIIAFCLNAEGVYIWKDVKGVLNADPKYFKDAQKLESMSYHDAIELAYFGASVIHPKTIKPLENKDIPLYVKSFMNPSQSGTIIGKGLETKPLIPSFIFKDNQILITIGAKDFAFIAEKNLSHIFGLFDKSGVKMNLMQNSAISFSVCTDHDETKVDGLLNLLMKDYKVLYNKDLQLYTVRHYYSSTIEMLTVNKEILLEQRSRHTAQFVTREKSD